MRQLPSKRTGGPVLDSDACLFMGPTTPASPSALTHNSSASCRVPATAVRKKGRTGSAPPWGLICLISPSLWMPAQGLWPFCCPTFEHRVKGLEWESGTLFLLKGDLLGHMKSLCQLPSSQMLSGQQTLGS